MTLHTVTARLGIGWPLTFLTSMCMRVCCESVCLAGNDALRTCTLKLPDGSAAS